jgi:hypothetical protein
VNQSPQQAQRYVLISVFGLLVIAAYRGKLSTADVSFTKRLWGTGVLAVMLGLIADVAPQIAGPFALLILAGSVTHGGDKALQNFLGKIGSSGGGGGQTISKPQPGSTFSGAKGLPSGSILGPPSFYNTPSTP